MHGRRLEERAAGRDRRVEGRRRRASGASTLIASVIPPNLARGSAGRFASAASSCHGNSPMWVSAVLNQAISSLDELQRSQPSAS